jgi:peptide subunit release factor 1 (eRF1)
MTNTAQKRILNRTRMLAWLKDLGADPDAAGVTISLKHDVSPEDIQRHVKQVPARPEIVEQCTYHAGKATAGTVIIWSEKHKYLVHPPFPIATTCITPGIDVSVLHELLSYDYLIGVVLVRLGAYAVGVAKGEKLLSSKVGTGNIHARHHKGGSSANRFRRHRENRRNTS